jgi:lipooligosaccharide transport system permease protein
MVSTGSTVAGSSTTAPGRLEMLGRQFDYWATVYRRTWKGSVISSFLQPVLYVAAMGVLLGGFIDRGGTADLEGASSYLVYVAPGFIAVTAMQTAVGEVLWPVMGMIKWHKTYYAMLATPLRVADLVAAHLAFAAFRIMLTCAVFMVVLAFFGVYTTVGGTLAAFAVQLLVGMAFAAPLYGFSAGVKSEEAFGVVYRLGIIPLSLFSGAFFPIDNLGPVLEWVARFTPLWHGVDLTRMLVLGHVDPALAAVHLAVLVLMVVVGWWWAVRRLTARLTD